MNSKRRFFDFKLLLVLLPVIISLPSFAAPKIKVSESAWEVGEVYQNQSVSKEITISNEGDEELVIHDISKTCGCISSTPAPLNIQPSSQMVLPIVFESGSTIGQKIKKLILFSNDPNSPETAITITGFIIVDFLIEPPYLFFPDLKFGESRQEKVTLRSSDKNKGFSILEVRPSSSIITAALVHAQNDSDALTLDVTVEAASTIGLLDERIILLTDSPNQKQVILPIRGLVRGDITLKPNRLYYKVVDSKKEVERTVDIINSSPLPLEIIAIDTDIDNLQLNTVPLKPGIHFQIQAKLTPPFERGRIMGTIAIKTNNPHQPELSVLVNGFVKPLLEDE